MENQSPAEVMSVKDWIITMLISFIPFVGFIMLFVWAFSSGVNPNKSNWAKAALIWVAIWTVFFIIFYGTIAAIFMSGAGGNDFDV